MVTHVDFVSVQINDMSMAGTNDAAWGPLSKVYMCSPESKTKIVFNNPSPTILWGVDSKDDLIQVKSTHTKKNTADFLTVSGVITLATGNTASHLIKGD